MENERLKTLLQEMEKDINEKNAAYDRERVLWENKFNFLVQQRDQAREDQAEGQRKFDSTIEHLNKRGSNDKKKLEETSNSLIKSIENRHQAHVSEIDQTYRSEVDEARARCKTLEENARVLQA